MLTKMKLRFTDDFFQEIKEKENAAALSPILERAKLANNETEMMNSEEVETLCSMHPMHTEECRNLCMNIYRQRASLDCHTEVELYHHVYTNADISIGASHVLNKIAKIFCSCPPESIVESMGSIITKICSVRGGSKTSTNQSDVKDISDELIIHWNGPHISHCQGVVKQTLNVHFGGGAWHFVSEDVRAKLYTVSKVVDRINRTKEKLTFMSDQ
jgi:hypothetical protein